LQPNRQRALRRKITLFGTNYNYFIIMYLLDFYFFRAITLQR
jgi:hypothetical protein